MRRDGPVEYVDQALRAARLALSYVDGMDRVAFGTDQRTQQAVVMNLLIIGEAAARLTSRHPDFIRAHAAVPWPSMRGMRNRIAHGYFEIDLDIVWDTVRAALPSLLSQLETIRQQFGPSTPDDGRHLT